MTVSYKSTVDIDMTVSLAVVFADNATVIVDDCVTVSLC